MAGLGPSIAGVRTRTKTYFCLRVRILGLYKYILFAWSWPKDWMETCTLPCQEKTVYIPGVSKYLGKWVHSYLFFGVHVPFSKVLEVGSRYPRPPRPRPLKDWLTDPGFWSPSWFWASGQVYTWIFQLCRISAFSSIKSTEQHKFCTVGRSRYIHDIRVTGRFWCR